MMGRKIGVFAPIAVLAALVMLLAGPLVKYGVLPWRLGLAGFALSALLGGIAGLICVIQLIRRRGGRLAIGGALAGLGAFAVLVTIIMGARGLPPIHDISTDTAHPPQFESITPAVRGAGTNALVYDPANAPLQAEAYPDVKPRLAAKPLPALFDRALRTVVDRGWTVVAADKSSGRIEATATAGWWGFKDDVVIRLTPEGAGTRIDIRSVSRVGVSDLGANAHRIVGLLDAIAG